MDKLVSCTFNMDSGCVELQWENGTLLSIICDAVERSFETTLQQRSEMNWLIYNDPLSYAQLVLGGGLSDYLANITRQG